MLKLRISTLLYATLRYSTLLYATLRYSTLLYATLRYSTLLYATLRYSTTRHILYYSVQLISFCTLVTHFSSEKCSYTGINKAALRESLDVR
jgi:hypothetical protein